MNFLKAVKYTGITSACIGAGLFISGLTYYFSSEYPKKPETPSIIFTRQQANATLRTLKREEEILNLPYKPDTIKKDLEDFFKDRLKRSNQLESMISAVEKDIQQMEESKEMEEYNKQSQTYSEKKTETETVALIMVITGILSAGLGGMLTSTASETLKEIRMEESTNSRKDNSTPQNAW